MFKYVKKHLNILISCILVLILTSLSGVYVQFLKGDLLNYALVQNNSKTLSTAVILLALIIFELITMYLSWIFENRFSFKCIKDLKEDLFKSIMNKNIKDFNEKRGGDYIALMSNDVKEINVKYFANIPIVLALIIKSVLVIFALIKLNLTLAIMTILLLAMPILVPKLTTKIIQRAQKNQLEAVEAFTARFSEYLSGFETIKNYSITQMIFNKFVSSNYRELKADYDNKNVNSTIRLISATMSYCSHFIIIAISVYLVLVGKFNAGQFFVAVGLVDQLSYPLISISRCIQNFEAAKSVKIKLAEYLSHVEVTEANKGGHKVEKFERSIEFKDVSFKYNNKLELLNNFSMSFEKGKKYLVKGESGSGKTTLINLILNYFDNYAGRINFDGVDISNINNIEDMVAIVRQDTFLFNDTLRNNVCLYKNVKDEDIIEVLKQVNLDKYATKDGLQYMVSEYGTNLSGGEKNRLAFARALLHDKPILILDEPTANLDSITSRRIETEIIGLKNITVIMVAHKVDQDIEERFDSVIYINNEVKSSFLHT